MQKFISYFVGLCLVAISLLIVVSFNKTQLRVPQQNTMAAEENDETNDAPRNEVLEGLSTSGDAPNGRGSGNVITDPARAPQNDNGNNGPKDSTSPSGAARSGEDLNASNRYNATDQENIPAELTRKETSKVSENVSPTGGKFVTIPSYPVDPLGATMTRDDRIIRVGGGSR